MKSVNRAAGSLLVGLAWAVLLVSAPTSLAAAPYQGRETFAHPLSGGFAIVSDIYRNPRVPKGYRCEYGGKNCAVTGAPHTGVDYWAQDSDERQQRIYPVRGGKIVMKVKNGSSDHGFGNTLMLEHRLSDGRLIYSQYSHLARFSARVDGLAIGQTLGTTDVIGVMGGTGSGLVQKYGTHLHLEMKTKPTLADPRTSKTHFGYMKTATNDSPDAWGYLNPLDYTGVPAQMTDAYLTYPVMFLWSAGSKVSEYWIWLGTRPGGSDLYSASQGGVTSLRPSGILPAGKLYVRLFSRTTGTAWPPTAQPPAEGTRSPCYVEHTYTVPPRPIVLIDNGSSARRPQLQPFKLTLRNFAPNIAANRWLCNAKGCWSLEPVRTNGKGFYEGAFAAPCSQTPGTYTLSVQNGWPGGELLGPVTQVVTAAAGCRR